MAEKEAAADAGAAEEAPKKKGGKKKLIIIILAVVLVGGGGYWFFLKPGGASATICPPTTLPGWKPASAKQLEAAKAVTKTSPPGETPAAGKARPGADAPAAEGTDAAAKEACEPPEPPVPGAVVKMEPMTISLAVLVVTGVLFWNAWFPDLPIVLRRIGVLLHALAAVVLVLTVIVHIYAAIWVKGTTRAMTRGTVSRGWAKANHPLWYRDMTQGK